MSDSSLFENIVSAISKCGLGDSLQTVNIDYCKLDRDKIQQMFENYDMGHVNVIDSHTDLPLTE